MNDGQTNSTYPMNPQDFFTTGQGGNSAREEHNEIPEDDLNAENWNTPIQRDPRTVGNATMATMDNSPQTQAPEELRTPEPIPQEYAPVELPPPPAPNRFVNNPNRPGFPEEPNMAPGMGEITPLEPEMSSDTPNEKKEAPEDTASTQPTGDSNEINPSAFHPNGEKISHETIEATKKLISSFDNNKIDPATFKSQYGEACRAYQGINKEEDKK